MSYRKEGEPSKGWWDLTEAQALRLAELERAHVLPVEADPFMEDVWTAADAYWGADFHDASPFEGDEYRCPVTLPNIKFGREAAGSWHQINNGAERTWTRVYGEMGWR